MSETIVVENVSVFQVLRVAAALALEINTGLKHSQGSIMNLAKAYCGSPKRTKKGVLLDYTEWLKAEMPGYEPNPSVARALTK